jgi:hypothetical protein
LQAIPALTESARYEEYEKKALREEGLICSRKAGAGVLPFAPVFVLTAYV